jgi:hypothetical protein
MRLGPLAFGLSSLAVAMGGCPLFGPFTQGQQEPRIIVTAPEAWPHKQLYAGKTAVETDAIELRGVHWTVLGSMSLDQVKPARAWVALVRTADAEPHPFSVELQGMTSGSVRLLPEGGLDSDTEYLLAFPNCAFQPHLLCPPPITFRTGSAPQVVGLWRAEDTLLVVFSEPMDGASLYLGHDSVDMVFEEGAVTRSVVADLNVADFVWATEGPIFMVAPISKVPFRLVLGPKLRSALGARLDVDGDGTPGDPFNFVHPVEPVSLPTCHTRADYPDPCLSPEQAELVMVQYEAPFDVMLDVEGLSHRVSNVRINPDGQAQDDEAFFSDDEGF